MTSQVYIVSDSTGETGYAMARALCAQFPDLKPKYRVFAECQTSDQVKKIIEEADKTPKEDKEAVLVFNSIMIPEMNKFLSEICKQEAYIEIDLYRGGIEKMEEGLGLPAVLLPGLSRNINKDYLNKISSIEFAVRFDDGKDPRGLLLADIVILGVSRTSKTPLSMFLANKGYNVANLPLVPEIPLPAELDRVDNRRLIGLIISPGRLNEIRKGRLMSLGLMDSSYADDSRIHKELDYANRVFSKIACPVIDVTESTIEETAAKIIELVDSAIEGEIRRYEDPDKSF